jgi:hypothetical protein
MGPYTKSQTATAIDDGWEIKDGDGAVIAILDTETMADALLRHLQNDTKIVIALSGGIVEDVLTNIAGGIDVEVIDDDDEPGDDASEELKQAYADDMRKLKEYRDTLYIYPW